MEQLKSDNQQLLQTNVEVRHNCVCIHGSMQCQPYNHCHGWFAQVVAKSDDYCQAEQSLQAEVYGLKVKAHHYVAISILLQECVRVIR